MAAPQKKVASIGTEIAEERFIRILKHAKKPNDHFDGYQTEVLTIRGDKVIGRELVGKADLFEFAFAQAADLIDPRNMEKFESANAPV